MNELTEKDLRVLSRLPFSASAVTLEELQYDTKMSQQAVCRSLGNIRRFPGLILRSETIADYERTHLCRKCGRPTSPHFWVEFDHRDARIEVSLLIEQHLRREAWGVAK